MASRSIKNRPGIKKKHPSIGFLAVFTVFLAVIVAGFSGVYALGSSWIGDLEDYDVSDAGQLNSSLPSIMLASDGTELARFQVEYRDPVELDQISEYVREGTVATEDERFYEHGGFDLAGIARAVYVNLTGSGKEGASTITQQLVRNTILADEMNDISFKRKVREMYLSVKLEEQYSKDEILLMYLNTINYGSGAYGIEAASQRYFSKHASELTLAEAAALIGIPQSPTYNNPIDHEDNCLARRNLVLDRMLTNGYITQEEHDAAQAEGIVLNTTETTVDGLEKYPYFSSYVRDLLMDPDGDYRYSDDELFKGGLTIQTTLDVDSQEAAEAAIKEKRESLNPAIYGALVAIEPETGYIKAMVGGEDDEWATQKLNLATGERGVPNPGRPSGSSFKVFTLIAALEAGISPQTMVDCSSPATIPNTEYGSTIPPLENINNYNYGTRSIQRAFAVSSNTGFVRLEMAVGIDKVIKVAKDMGITSALSANPSLTLGQSNVTMLDMASAYAVIANGGVRIDPTPVLTITNSKGEVIVDNTTPDTSLSKTHREQVISPEVAHAATEVMKSVVNTSEGTGQKAALPNGQVVAAKTGTSESYKDITFCGITPQLATAIWFGDPSNQVTIPTSTGADDVFSRFMSAVLDGQPTEQFPQAADPTYKNFSDPT
ncbi:transglycosylase domain-containing protein, partial [Eggerthella lenta]